MCVYVEQLVSATATASGQGVPGTRRGHRIGGVVVMAVLAVPPVPTVLAKTDSVPATAVAVARDVVGIVGVGQQAAVARVQLVVGTLADRVVRAEVGVAVRCALNLARVVDLLPGAWMEVDVPPGTVTMVGKSVGTPVSRRRQAELTSCKSEWHRQQLRKKVAVCRPWPWPGPATDNITASRPPRSITNANEDHAPMQTFWTDWQNDEQVRDIPAG
eukprot:SAG22_NODE_2980_length_2055_cov_1.562372_1_plen_216_part_00